MPLDDEATVSFPATPDFARVGRVTAAGLALRLGFDVRTVENLRLAVDAAVRALTGIGTITLFATWSEQHLDLTIENANAKLDDVQASLASDLRELVSHAEVSGSSVSLEIEVV